MGRQRQRVGVEDQFYWGEGSFLVCFGRKMCQVFLTYSVEMPFNVCIYIYIEMVVDEF